MTTKSGLLEEFCRSIGSDAAVTARLEKAQDEATFIRLMADIAREKGFNLAEHDLRAIVDHRAAVSGELSDERLASVAGGTSARDRRKAGLDNIQKFLDILRSMNPQI